MNPILVALDVDSAERAEDLARSVYPYVGGFKVGLQLVMAEGPRSVGQIARLGKPVFADLKLHDIPNTVRSAATAMAAQGARWVTAHASGGRQMIEAAVEGLQVGSSHDVGVLGVTVLTSMDDSDLATVGVTNPEVSDQVGRLSEVSSSAGAEGVICSPNEVSVVKAVDSRLLAVTPGIRSAVDEPDDQKRINTPTEAIRLGADFLVIGRSITSADNPVEAAKAIQASLEALSQV